MASAVGLCVEPPRRSDQEGSQVEGESSLGDQPASRVCRGGGDEDPSKGLRLSQIK